MKIAQPYAAITLEVNNCTALRCYHLGGKQFAQFCAIITLMVKM